MSEQQDFVHAPEVREIDLTGLFWSCMLHWRFIIICILVFALALGTYKAVGFSEKINDPDYRKSADETNQRLEEVYTVNKEQIEDRMQGLSDEIERQKNYMANSVLYNIDPYRVFVREVTYYIDTDYVILPEMGVQNPDYTGAVVNAYKTIAQQVNIDNVLYGDTESAQGYDKRSEFITATTGAVGTLSIRVRGNSQEQADAIMAAIEGAIFENKHFIQNTIADHEISVISDCRSQDADPTLVALHDANEAKMAALTDSYFKVLDEYKNLKEPDYIQLGRNALILSVIKNSITGAVAGAFAAVFVIFALFLFRDTVINEEDINTRYNSTTFGTILERKRGRIDLWVFRHLGTSGLERSDQIKMVAVKIKQKIEKAEKLMLLGDVETPVLEQLSDELKANGITVQLIAGKERHESADTLLQLQQCDALILTEMMQKTSHRQVRNQMNMARQIGKKELGYILLL